MKEYLPLGYRVLRVFDRMIFGVLQYVFVPLCLVALYTLEFGRSVLRPGFAKRYPLSCLMVVLTLVLSLIQTTSEPTYEQISIDKWLCMSFYFVLTSVFWVEYLKHHKMREIDYNWAWFPCIVAPLLMSACIEILQQYLISSRQGEWMDFAFNAVGIGLSAIVWSVIFAHRKNIMVITDIRSYER